jgi:hypothetical protein
MKRRAPVLRIFAEPFTLPVDTNRSTALDAPVPCVLHVPADTAALAGHARARPVHAGGSDNSATEFDVTAPRHSGSVEPKRFYHRHCSRFRKASGTGHASNLYLQPGTLKWVSGEEQIRAFEVPEAKPFTSTLSAVCGDRLQRQPKDTDSVMIPAGRLSASMSRSPTLNRLGRSRPQPAICPRFRIETMTVREYTPKRGAIHTG